MKYVAKSAIWFFWWSAWQVRKCFGKPHMFHDYMWWTIKTSFPPWWKFRPYCHHNEYGKQWEVWFDNETTYTESRTIRVQAHIGMDSGRIVGLTIYDGALSSPGPGAPGRES